MDIEIITSSMSIAAILGLIFFWAPPREQPQETQQMSQNEVQQMPEKQPFNTVALRILQENSGGMKYLEFLACIITEIHEGKLDLSLEATPDQIELLLRQHPNIHVLTYSWHMSPETAREKMFVYTP